MSESTAQKMLNSAMGDFDPAESMLHSFIGESYGISHNILPMSETKKQILATLNVLRDTLVSTLGPYGTTTLIQNKTRNQHRASKDGYSVLRNIIMKEELPSTVLTLVNVISRRLVRTVGDGSTTAVVASANLFGLIQEKFSEDVPPTEILKALEIIADALRQPILDSAKPLTDYNHILNIAKVSTNGDVEMATIIADVFTKVGADSTVNVLKGGKTFTEVKYATGVKVNRGFKNPASVNVPSQTNPRCIFTEGVKVLMVRGLLDKTSAILLQKAIEAANNESKALLIIASEYDTFTLDALNRLLTEHRGSRVVHIDIATREHRKMEEFLDLAKYVNCDFFDAETDERADLFDATTRLGECAGVEASMGSTIVTGGIGSDESINERIAIIEEAIVEIGKIDDHIERNGDINWMQQRMANLRGGIAEIHIGGHSNQEVATKYDLAEDAVFAVRSALKHGYVTGGSTCIPRILLNDKEFVNSLYDNLSENTFLDDGGIVNILNCVTGSFLDVFSAISRMSKLPIFRDTVKKSCLEIAPETDEAAFSSVNIDKTIISVMMEHDVILNAKTHQFEKTSETDIINSAATEIEVLTAICSIIGLIATSNQFVAGYD